MAIRLNSQPINRFLLSGRTINRIMLNSQRVWPEGKIEDNNIKIQVVNTGNSNNNSYCFGSMRMWDKTYNEILFNNIDRIGNPEGAANPLNFEAVISNDDTICTIKHNLGYYYYYPIPNEWVLKKTNYDGAYAWLPNPIGIPLYQGNASYVGYRHYLTSNNKLTPGETYDINVSSVGVEVKYLMMEFGNNTSALSTLNHIPLKIMYRDDVVYEYATEPEFRTDFLLTVNGFTYRKVHIFSTDGNVYIAWVRNRTINNDLRDKLYICKRTYFKGRKDYDIKTVEETTLQNVVELSDGLGFINIEYDLGTSIDITTERTIANDHNSTYHQLTSVLLYDVNHELIVDPGSETETSNIRYNQKADARAQPNGVGYVDLNKNNEEHHIGMTVSNGYSSFRHFPLAALGIVTTDSGWGYGMAFSNKSTAATGVVVNWTIQSSKEVKLVGIPLFSTNLDGNKSWLTKMTVNGMTVGGYLATEKAKLKEEQYKSSAGMNFVRRYFFDVINNKVYCSYVRAISTTTQYLESKKIYVYARDTKRMHQITIDELLTGNYPDGEFEECTKWTGQYVFELGNPVYSGNIEYVTLSGLKVIDKSGKVFKVKTNITPPGHYTGHEFKSYTHTVILDNDEPFTITVSTGSYAGNAYYYVSDMFPRKYLSNLWSCWLSARNSEGPKQQHIVRFATPSDDKVVLFFPWWYYSANYYLTSYTKLLYINNNNQVLKDFVSDALDNGTIKDATARTGAIWSYTYNREVKTVKGVTYYRAIMATVDKAYIIWIKDADAYFGNTTSITGGFKYNEEYDEMLEMSIQEIIDKDLTGETVPTPPLPAENITFKLAMNYSWHSTNWFGVVNGMIYTEDPDTKGFKLINHADLKNNMYKRVAGYSPDETFNHMQRFVDPDGEIYEIKTNAGAYNNANSHDLFNMFSSVQRTSVAQYGYLSGYLSNGGYSDRLFSYVFTSTAKIKALCFQTYYTGGLEGGYYAVPGKFVYNDEVIYDFPTHGEAWARLWNERMFKRWVIFPDRKELMCVRTPNNGLTNYKGVSHTPHYLWNRRTFKHDEISIEDLYNLDKELVKYDRDDASYYPPIPEINRIELDIAKTWNGPYDAETYMALGNCLMFDEEYNVINLTFKSVTRVPTTEDRNEGAYTTSIWTDPDGNEYALETDAGIHSSTYKIEHTFTAAYTIPNTNTNVNEWLAYNNDMTTLDENGKVVKWRHFNIIGRTKKIGAVAISTGARGKNGSSGYGYLVYWGFPSYVRCRYKEEDPDDSTQLIEKERDLFNYPTKADYNSDIKFSINSKVWYKRMVALDDGRVFTTWLPYNFKF